MLCHPRLSRRSRRHVLDGTRKAYTLRGPGAGVVLDGPFAETKEQLLGF
jgi:hypothetical protein